MGSLKIPRIASYNEIAPYIIVKKEAYGKYLLCSDECPNYDKNKSIMCKSYKGCFRVDGNQHRAINCVLFNGSGKKEEPCQKTTATSRKKSIKKLKTKKQKQ